MTQERAIELALSGHNIFLTGKAGTGKSYTTNKIIEQMRKSGKSVAVTATTGIAATHIDGQTIHSWAGIGIKEEVTDEMLFGLSRNRFTADRMKIPDVLIIDEISMLHDYRFDMVDEVLRFVRSSNAPFGGMQVIVVGDFHQLPPVNRNNKKNYTFNAKAWAALDFRVCYLEKIYRQSDEQLIEVLNAIREARIEDRHKDILDAALENKHNADKAINLYCKNKEVRFENEECLAKVDSNLVTFKARTQGHEMAVKKITGSWNGEENLSLKVGARVMFLVNKYMQGGDIIFTNGQMGEVVEFVGDDAVVVKPYNGDLIVVTRHEWKLEEEDSSGKMRTVAKVLQIPLRLAYAITIHKSQGSSFDYVNLDLSDAFTTNQGYVALSRVRTLAGLNLIGYKYGSLLQDSTIVAKDREFYEASRGNE